MIDKNGIEKLYMIHSGTGSTFRPIYKTKRKAISEKKKIFVHPEDLKKAWIEELVVAK